MKPAPPPLTVGTPCPKRWAELTGDDTRRYCGQCQLHVHNLSAMAAGEREKFVADSGGRECIAYELNADGTMATRSRWPWLARLARPFKWAALTGLSALLPFWFAGCTTRKGATPTMGVPMPPPEPRSAHAHGVSSSEGPAQPVMGKPMMPSPQEKTKP